MPPLTLYFLESSRSIRIAWLLEELHLDYVLVSGPRNVNGNKAPASLKAQSGSHLGKFPVLRDGELVVVESGAITDYLLETYDEEGRLSPTEKDVAARVKVRQWIHAAEGTFLMHALAVKYARSAVPESLVESVWAAMEKALAVNVRQDLDWLEYELSKGGEGKFLVGESLTAADTMMAFSVQYIKGKKLGVESLKEWPRVEGWLEGLEGGEGYRRAVERTGHRL